MGVIKQISIYNGNDWVTDDIGVNASNVDLSSNIYGANNVQGVLNNLLPTSKLSGSKVIVTNSNNKLTASNINTTQLSYLSGLRTNVQNQLDSKADQGGPFIRLASDITAGSPPTSEDTYGGGFVIRDSSNTMIGQLASRYRTNGELGIYLQAYNPASSASQSLSMSIDSNNSPIVTMSAPAAWRNALGINNTIKEISAQTVSVPTSQYTTICNTGSLSPGTYIITFATEFTGNPNGTTRVMFLSSTNTPASTTSYSRNSITSVGPAGGNPTRPACTFIHTISNTTTFYLRVYQNSGSTLNVVGTMRFLKIH